MIRRLRQSPFVHPLLFAVFPVVFLWAENRTDQVRFSDVGPPLGVILAAVVVLFVVLRMVVGAPRAGLLTSTIVVLFFSFGHVRKLVDPLGDGLKDTGLLATWALLAFIGVVLCVRAGRFAPGLTRGLNLIALVLVAMNLVRLVDVIGQASAIQTPYRLPGVDPRADAPKRDVYYIILDRYANDRTLRDDFDFDNEPFLGFLSDEGFVVTRDTIANYPKTAHSLASSLNMEYLDDLVAREGPDSDDWQPILSSLDGSRVASAFQGLGYRYDHVGSWWEPTREDPTADRNYEYGHLSEFTSVLLDTTIWPTIARKTGVMDWMSWEETQYHRVLYQFDAIESISHDPRPTFTFVHFTLPHFPYVFDAEGHYVSREELYRLGVDEAYLQQLEYTNVRVRQLVTDLLAGPDDRDPIIVLQSDEGPHPAALEADQEGYVFPAAPTGELAEKLRVLNAYFLPGNGTPRPYDTISPVNTFRLIFDRYFGADLPLLEDRTYVYFDEHHPYQLTDVTSRLRS